MTAQLHRAAARHWTATKVGRREEAHIYVSLGHQQLERRSLHRATCFMESCCARARRKHTKHKKRLEAPRSAPRRSGGGEVAVSTVVRILCSFGRLGLGW